MLVKEVVLLRVREAPLVTERVALREAVLIEQLLRHTRRAAFLRAEDEEGRELVAVQAEVAHRYTGRHQLVQSGRPAELQVSWRVARDFRVAW